MPLLEADIKRLKRQDNRANFYRVKKDGELQLKNKDGKCFFHDGEHCLIYDDRPEGCKIYPVIYDEDADCVILDKECPYNNQFKISRLDRILLRRLIKKLDWERKERLK